MKRHRFNMCRRKLRQGSSICSCRLSSIMNCKLSHVGLWGSKLRGVGWWGTDMRNCSINGNSRRDGDMRNKHQFGFPSLGRNTKLLIGKHVLMKNNMPRNVNSASGWV